MKRLIIILLIMGGLYFIVSKNILNDNDSTDQAQPEHAAITKMALESEAKAKQAAAIAATDTVAAYEQSQEQ
jgi:uncharacterized protein (UPF0333 family)